MWPCSKKTSSLYTLAFHPVRKAKPDGSASPCRQYIIIMEKTSSLYTLALHPLRRAKPDESTSPCRQYIMSKVLLPLSILDARRTCKINRKMYACKPNCASNFATIESVHVLVLLHSPSCCHCTLKVAGAITLGRPFPDAPSLRHAQRRCHLRCHGQRNLCNL